MSDNQERVITGSSSHAYIKLAEGCNQSCSFCAIPGFKGKLHSRTLESVEKEVRRLTENGFYDFSFISQDSSSYLYDTGERDGLIRLIERVEKIEGVKSARILYLYPSTTSLELIDRIAESPVFQNYFDMPIQHIDPEILKRMKRGIGSDKIDTLLKAMRSVENSFVRTSVIIGFPTESDEQFGRLCDYLEEFGFDRVNVFEYSDEEGTDSYTLTPKVPPETVEKRLETVAPIVERSTLESLEKMVGRKVEAVVEGPSDEHEFLLSARPLLWAPDIDGELLINESELEDLKFGSAYTVEITQLAGTQLLGRIVDAR